MRFLHTSDWHLGKTLRGTSRLTEQREVMAEIVAIARSEDVDAVLVAGDIFDTAAPSPEAVGLALQTLLALRETGAEVIAIAGNHDHPSLFTALRPTLRRLGITLAGRVVPAADGGVVEFSTRSGENAVVALLPFLSQRFAVRAAELMTSTPAEQSATYDRRIRDILAALTESFRPDAVNLILAHLTVTGGAVGGGEREAHSIIDYHVPAQVFGDVAHYVALGHLHRRQQLPASCPVVYSGSPLAIDFGEQDNTASVWLVEARPGVPATWDVVPIRAARQLRTLHGTVAELAAMAGDVGEAYLRVRVAEPARAGLREDVMAALPNTLVIQMDPRFSAAREPAQQAAQRANRDPVELFGDYCAERGLADDRVTVLFGELLGEVQGGRALAEEVT